MLQWRIKQRGKLYTLLVCLLLLCAVLSACGQNWGSGSIYTDPHHPVVIGISISNKTDAQGDDFRSDAAATLRGYELWKNILNSRGGLLGRPVTFDILYDNSDPAMVAKNYATLITQHHVNLVFAPFSSLLTRAAAPIALKYGYLMVDGSGGAPSIFAQRWPNLFDVSLPVANNLITFAYYILSLPPDQRPGTAAYLSSDDPFTFPQVDRARKLLQDAGVRTVYPAGAQARLPQNPRLLNALPPGYEQFNEGDLKTAAADAALVAHTHADVAVLGTLLPYLQIEVPVFKQLHYNPKALIATAGPDDGQDFVNAVGGIRYTEGFFVPNGWYPQANTYQNAEMVQSYLARYGGTADGINADVAEAFSVGQVVQQAAEKIRSIDNVQLIRDLQSNEVLNTVQGTVQFSSARATMGQNLQAIAYLFQWQRGQFIPVYPYSDAAQNPEFPRLAPF